MAERPATDGQDGALNGARLLVVEDEFMILLELESILLEAGAASVSLCGTLDKALEQIETESFAAALLDMRVGRNDIAPVARALDRHGIPFAFYTGQLAKDPVRAEWPDRPTISKPAPARLITQTLAGLIETQA